LVIYLNSMMMQGLTDFKLILFTLGVRIEHLLYCTYEVCKRKCYKTTRWTVL